MRKADGKIVEERKWRERFCNLPVQPERKTSWDHLEEKALVRADQASAGLACLDWAGGGGLLVVCEEGGSLWCSPGSIGRCEEGLYGLHLSQAENWVWSQDFNGGSHPTSHGPVPRMVLPPSGQVAASGSLDRWQAALGVYEQILIVSQPGAWPRISAAVLPQQSKPSKSFSFQAKHQVEEKREIFCHTPCKIEHLGLLSLPRLKERMVCLLSASGGPSSGEAWFDGLMDILCSYSHELDIDCLQWLLHWMGLPQVVI